jgi:NAD(P)-dependent dehydrogenase (short-subunit alcohol dehydrogenase family)
LPPTRPPFTWEEHHERVHRIHRPVGRAVIVTGGGSVVGRAATRCCAAEGAKVLIADVSTESARAVAEEVTAASGTACTVSKHGIAGLTTSLAVMYRDDGVRANAIAPGGTRTNLQADIDESEHGARAGRASAGCRPVGRTTVRASGQGAASAVARARCSRISS